MTAALQTLLEHAEGQRDEALAATLLSEGTCRRLQQQAEQLLVYRDEYRQRHPAQGGRSASIELVRCHEGFMQRLDQAIAQQQQQLQAAEARIVAQRSALMACETRVASVRKLLERRGAQARHTAARQDQRRSDDAAQNQQRRADDVGHGMGWRLGSDVMPLTH
jgi:flagellar FliJ protein